MLVDLALGDILRTDMLRCDESTSIVQAARRMLEAKCSSILIERDGEIVGIWTERDALSIDLYRPGLGEEPICNFMSSPVRTLPARLGIGEAAYRFREEGVRHFLVTDDFGVVRGIVSQSDVVNNQGIEHFVSLRELKSVFRGGAKPIPSSTPLPEALQTMRDRRLDALVVIGPDGQYGLLSERDVVRAIALRHPLRLVHELTSYPLITVPISLSLYQARKAFQSNDIRHLGVTDTDGRLIGMVAYSDIMASIEREYVQHLYEALHEAQASIAEKNLQLQLAARAFESTHEGIIVTDAQSVIQSVNPAFTQITGYTPAESIGQTPRLLSSGRHDAAFYQAMSEALETTGFWQGEICNRRKNGEIYVEWLTINAVRDHAGRVTNYVAVFTDFTARKAAEEHAHYLSMHDSLTGLPNRRALNQHLNKAIAHAHRNHKKLAVVFLDLDLFKEINDTYGHAAGDEVLRCVASRLSESMRGEDVICRFAGDEFVLLLENLASEEAARRVVAKLGSKLAKPVPYQGAALRTSCSIGVSVFPDDAGDADGLIALADRAMYAAKQKGRNASFFYSDVAQPISGG